MEKIKSFLYLCPSCHGVGKIVSGGKAVFCLVCNDIRKAIRIFERQPDSSFEEWIEDNKQTIRDFLRLCPSCYGARAVYSSATLRACLVCTNLYSMLETIAVPQDFQVLTPNPPGFLD